MIRRLLAHDIQQSIDALIAAKSLPPANYGEIEVADTKNPDHGDYACNIALTSAKLAGINPRAFAELLKSQLDANPNLKSVEIAGPGFLNLRIDQSIVARTVENVLEQGAACARSVPKHRESINVEFVSVNPNGPITIGSGRGAAFGDTLCRVLEAAGHTVWREYYINDGVNSEQMRLFAASVEHFWRAKADLPTAFPENGYKGDYVEEVADRIWDKFGGYPIPGFSAEAPGNFFRNHSQAMMIEKQREDLATFGVRFDTWFSEQSLHDKGMVESALQKLLELKVADDEPVRNKWVHEKGEPPTLVSEPQQSEDDDSATEGTPTIWLRSSRFGDDQDRVLRRRDGRLTYIASDVAYHNDKFNRPPNATKLITVLGPDHHGYIQRLKSVVQALGYREDQLEVIIFQIVRFVKEGKPAPMRKRDGNIYALIDLIDEIGKAALPDDKVSEQQRVGADVARFFYLMRSHDTHMDFDIDLAIKQSDENPVFYVQYAHARICSVMSKAEEAGFTAADIANADLSLLTHEREATLAKKVSDLSYEVGRSALDYGVHRIVTYAIELSRTYHAFYDACRVVQPDQPELSRARLALCRATLITLRATFDLLGISAPTRMHR